MSFDTPLPPYNASDPHATFLNASCLDLLLIEMVPMAYRIAEDLTLSTPTTTATTSIVNGNKKQQGAGGEDEEVREEKRKEIAQSRLEGLGWRVGVGVVERFSRDRARFTDTLDMIKFLCKDLWTLLFRKQIDNLKTNHRGVYVLTDNSFRPLARMSMASPAEAVARAQPFLWFPCGVIRGALASMGLNATVQAETNDLPGAVFQIRTITAKS